MNELGKGDIPKGAKFVEIAVKNFLDYTKDKKILRRASLAQDDNFGFKIVTKSGLTRRRELCCKERVTGRSNQE